MHVVVRPPRPPGTPPPGLLRRVIVRFKPGAAPPWVENAETHLAGLIAAAWNPVLHMFPGVTLHLDPALPPAIAISIPGHVHRARVMDPTFRDPHFERYFGISVPPGLPAVQVEVEARGIPGVLYSYLESGWTPAPTFTPENEPYLAHQAYLDPHRANPLDPGATAGIGVKSVWHQPGARGETVEFADVESGWNQAHPDLDRGGAPVLEELDPLAHRHDPEHGVNVIGVISAQDNTRGIVGIASESAACGSNLFLDAAGIQMNRAAAVLRPLARLVPGDVILIQDQVTNPLPTAQGFLPVEVEPLTYYAIRLATAVGIIVVEAAGNGAMRAAVGGMAAPFDLDGLIWGTPPRRVFDITAADYRDSGAIMVAAGTSWYPHEPSVPTCVGRRVNCFAWGNGVESLSMGAGDEMDALGNVDKNYTRTFNGTSAASAIVTGAALILQGLVKASGQPPVTSKQMRGLLANPASNTKSKDPPADKIGVMPDLERITASPLTQRAELYVRDFVGDHGLVPSPGTLSASPDIILRRTLASNPQTAFGQGSGVEDDAFLSETANVGQMNFVYVRVRNRGPVDAPNVGVRVYWSPPSTLVTPKLWTEVGTTVIPVVPHGESLTVSPEIKWDLSAAGKGPQSTGHYCFVAIIGNDDDPSPEPDRTDDPSGSNPVFRDWDEFNRFVSDNNNVAWRNVDVVAADSGSDTALPFYIVGPEDREREMELVIHVRLPRGVRVEVRPLPWRGPLPPIGPRSDFLDRLFASREGSKGGALVLPVGRTRIGPLPFPAGVAAPCELRVGGFKLKSGVRGSVSIHQLHEGRAVGGLTWHFVRGGVRE